MLMPCIESYNALYDLIIVTTDIIHYNAYSLLIYSLHLLKSMMHQTLDRQAISDVKESANINYNAF